MGRADIPLKAISYYILVAFLGWFICTVVISSLNDQNRLPSSGPAGNVNGAAGTLSYISLNHFYQYGAEGVLTFLAVLACWIAAYGQTRQVRAMALVATTWALFNWLVYTRFTFAALDYNSWNCGAIPTAGVSADTSSAFCRIGLASAIFSVLLESGKFLLWGWAVFRFFQLRGLEPYCELDKAEIEYEQKRQAGLLPAEFNNPNLPPVAGLDNGKTLGAATTPAPLHVSSVPAGLIEGDAPIAGLVGTAGVRITSLDQQRLSFSGALVMFFIALTLCGWIITTLSFIQLSRYGNQPNGTFGVYPGTFGDINLMFNIFFPSLTLMVSLSLGAVAAYDRLRNNQFSPLFLNVITFMQLWGLCIYSLRRATVDPADGTTSPAWASQQALAAGWAIMTFSETLRIGAMVLKACSTPPAVHPFKAEVSLFSGRIMYGITQSLMILTATAMFIVMIILQCEPSLFASGAQYASGPFLLDSPQSSLLWTYHNFAISLMVMGVILGTNYYIQVAGTRTAVFSSYVAQVFVTSTWWLLCWGPSYSMAVKSGNLYGFFCNDAFPSLICHANRAMGIIGLVIFGTFVLNLGVSLLRLILVDIGARSALPATELARQGSQLTRQEALARGTMGFGDTWISAELFLWIALAGWIIFAFGSTSWLNNDFFIAGNGFTDSFSFDNFSYLVAHFLSVTGLFSVFVTAHIVTNKTYRDHSHGFRYAQMLGFFVQFVFSIPCLILIARYQHLWSLDASHKAGLAGLVIFMGGQFFSLLQFTIYCIIYPALPVTVMLPVQQQQAGLVYDKMGNPIVNALPLDVEKGETLNPHHDQAGLGSNYTKTDYRHQGLANAGKDVNNDLSRDTVQDPALLSSERNTAITGTNQTTI